MYQYQNGGSTYLSTPIIRNYLYDGTEDNTFGRIKSITYSGFSNKAFSYTYNKFGYIETQSYDGNETSYVYDELGQLIRENNELLGKTYTYEYDSRGNILSKKTYAFTTGEISDDTPTLEADRLYSYASNSWKDQLTGYNGATITYDALGNPLSYNNGSAYTFTWQNGRQLASATVGSKSVSYEYDVNGLRTSKTVGGVVYNYYWQGSQLAAMTVTSGNTTDVLKFYYNASGIPTVFTYNGTQYYYITNLQGDVISIYDNINGKLGEYKYDAWGNVTIDTPTSYTDNIFNANPLRYRGYIYDTETGFYYLQSRYYDPTICRFVNADGYVSTGTGALGYNMYAYCNNNSVNFVDPTGALAFPGEIHNQVVNHISENNLYAREQRIIYDDGSYGRADLISDDGQVWDVKPNKLRHIKAGEEQVKKYITGKWAKKETLKLTTGGDSIAPNFFYYESGLITYRVEYSNHGNGVIVYDYEISNTNFPELPTEVVVIGVIIVIILGVVAGIGAGLGAPISVT